MAVIENKVALESLVKQRDELERQVGQLSAALDNAKTRFLKVSGAVEALEQIEGIVDENGNRTDVEPEAEATEVSETEVVE
jgi:hypothetical protein